jgi:hypothetical protein
MGAWGTGIFQDDTACDVRDEYRGYIGEGLSGAQATARILENYKTAPDDPDGGVVWLALAAVQWKLGRLDPETLAHALDVIDSGSDLRRWDGNPKDRTKRKAALDKLRAQILSPQAAEKKVTRRKLCESHWSEGDLFAYRVMDGRLILFRVIGNFEDKGGKYPVCELLDWIGEDIPGKDVLGTLEVKRSRSDHKHAIKQMMLVGLNQKSKKRVLEVEARLQPSPRQVGSSVVHFRYLDKFLKEWFLIG